MASWDSTPATMHTVSHRRNKGIFRPRPSRVSDAPALPQAGDEAVEVSDLRRVHMWATMTVGGFVASAFVLFELLR